MKVKTRETSVYVAKDGKEFDTAFACEEHERKMELPNLRTVPVPTLFATTAQYQTYLAESVNQYKMLLEYLDTNYKITGRFTKEETSFNLGWYVVKTEGEFAEVIPISLLYDAYSHYLKMLLPFNY